MRETLGVLLGFFLAAVLGYLNSEIAQKEQEKEVLAEKDKEIMTV